MPKRILPAVAAVALILSLVQEFPRAGDDYCFLQEDLSAGGGIEAQISFWPLGTVCVGRDEAGNVVAVDRPNHWTGIWALVSVSSFIGALVVGAKISSD